jgi:hypothetical protein
MSRPVVAVAAAILLALVLPACSGALAAEPSPECSCAHTFTAFSSTPIPSSTVCDLDDAGDIRCCTLTTPACEVSCCMSWRDAFSPSRS